MSLTGHIVHHRRLYLGGTAGLAVGALLPGGWSPPLRAIVGWDVGIVCYLALILAMMATSSHQHMRRRAAVEDEGRWALLALISTASLASLFAIGALLSGARALPADRQLVHFALGGVTIVLSWLFVHALYAVHYAHDHYRAVALMGAGAGAPAGLGFPGAPDPDYWDFCYFAYTIGMTAQTSDVSVNSGGLRRLVLVHGIVSFCFNTVLLALTINIAAGLL